MSDEIFAENELWRHTIGWYKEETTPGTVVQMNYFLIYKGKSDLAYFHRNMIVKARNHATSISEIVIFVQFSIAAIVKASKESNV